MIEVEPPADGRLYLVRVEPGLAVLSTGEEVRLPHYKLQHLAEQVIQEGVAVRVRTWWTPRGEELVELHRELTNWQPASYGSSDIT